MRELNKEEMIRLLDLMNKKYGGDKVYAGYDSKVYKKLGDYLKGKDEYGIDAIVDVVYDYELRKMMNFFRNKQFELVLMKYVIVFFESYVVAEYLGSTGSWRNDLERVLQMYNREEYEIGKPGSWVEKWRLMWWEWRVKRF